MSSLNFELCNDVSCNNYDATSVLYVSLTMFRNIFKFETTDISNNELPSSTLETSQNITYYVNSSNFPTINPAHSMMDASGSEGTIYTFNSSTSNLLKHDFIYHMGKSIIGDARFIGVFNNLGSIKNNIEELGWGQKTNTETIFTNADNSGNGLQNTIYSSNNSNQNNTNLTKRMLQQIKDGDPNRLTVISESNSNDRIQNTTGVQSVPLIEGDSINYFWTLKQTTIPDRKYRIKLHLTEDTNNTNTIPIDSIANTSDYPNITSNGVPTF